MFILILIAKTVTLLRPNGTELIEYVYRHDIIIEVLYISMIPICHSTTEKLAIMFCISN